MAPDKYIRVVLADDDDSDQELFQYALSKAHNGVELTLLSNGQKLIDHLQNSGTINPDIIFLDINMPGKDGKQCLAEIKGNDTFKNIPVVMYTTSDSKQDIEETFNKGANLYLPKPTSFQVLVKLLGRVFELNADSLLFPARERFVLSERTAL